MSWEIAYESLKTKEKSSVIIPKVVSVAYGDGRLRGRSLTRAFDYKVEVTVQTRFQKEVVANESGH